MSTPEGLRVAVVGATGNVGTVMLGLLRERDFPAREIVPFASERSAGRALDGGLVVQPLADETIQGFDVALFSAGATRSPGMDRLEAMGRAYMGYAYEFPHYFDFCSRFQAHSTAPDPSSNEGACMLASDQLIGTVTQAVESGVQDGSVRADIGDPRTFALTLWAFTHGIIQVTTAKGADLHGVAIAEFNDNAFRLLRRMAQNPPPD